MSILIDRCICFNRTFAELKATSREVGATTVEELAEHATFGQRCKLCRPYVEEMLRTGETEFSRIIREGDTSGRH